MDVRDTALVRARFVRRGVLTDPTTVQMIVTPPDGEAYTIDYPDAALAKASTGVFEGLVPVPTAGRWRVDMVGTGTAAGGGFATFFVFE